MPLSNFCIPKIWGKSRWPEQGIFIQLTDVLSRASSRVMYVCTQASTRAAWVFYIRQSTDCECFKWLKNDASDVFIGELVFKNWNFKNVIKAVKIKLKFMRINMIFFVTYIYITTDTVVISFVFSRVMWFTFLVYILFWLNPSDFVYYGLLRDLFY
jgi:hypothetical protein